MKRLLSILLTVAATLSGSTAFAWSTHEVQVLDDAFFPNAIWFQPGDKIKFVNATTSSANLKLVGASSYLLSSALSASGGNTLYTIPSTTEITVESPYFYKYTSGGCRRCSGYYSWSQTSSIYKLSIIPGYAPTSCPNTRLDVLAKDGNSNYNACPSE